MNPLLGATLQIRTSAGNSATFQIVVNLSVVFVTVYEIKFCTLSHLQQYRMKIIYACTCIYKIYTFTVDVTLNTFAYKFLLDMIKK